MVLTGGSDARDLSQGWPHAPDLQNGMSGWHAAEPEDLEPDEPHKDAEQCSDSDEGSTDKDESWLSAKQLGD